MRRMEKAPDSIFREVVITAIREEVEGFRTFQFVPSTGEEIRYQSGQYITLAHQGRVHEVRRSYSFTSAPVLNEPMSIGVKRIPNGSFSRLMFQLKPGDRLTTTGTGGFFTLPAQPDMPTTIFMLAAGAGITPIFSMIKTAMASMPLVSIVLIYSSPSPARTIFLDELRKLRENNPGRLVIEFLFSSYQLLEKARLSPLLLSQFLSAYSGNIAGPLFYLCGPEAYMRMCLFALREARIPEPSIRKETFVIHRDDISKPAPPDQRPHHAKLRYNGREYDLLVQYPNTILETAKRMGITLPYSCETGRCGNCVARLLSGKVWMSNNEVLTDAEIDRGLALTCTGYPIETDITLEV